MDQSTGPAVVLTRETEDNRELAAALAERGVAVREIPCLATRYVSPDEMPGGRVDALTFSSRRGVRGAVRAGILEALLPPGHDVIVAAVGPATAAELAANGIQADLTPDPPEGSVLAGLLLERLSPASRVAVVRGNLRAGKMDEALTAAGHTLLPLVVYENYEPEVTRFAPFPVAGIFAASPSAARRLVEKNPWMLEESFFVIGRTSAAELERLGAKEITRMGAGHRDWVEALTAARRRAASSP